MGSKKGLFLPLKMTETTCLPIGTASVSKERKVEIQREELEETQYAIPEEGGNGLLQSKDEELYLQKEASSLPFKKTVKEEGVGKVHLFIW